jgi:hydrogenase maturation protease
MSSREIPEPSALVIGYGNPLRQDDGVGWVVSTRLLADRPEGTAILTCHQLTPELAERISSVAVVVFVDAALGEGPGRVDRRPVRADESGPLSASHDLSPQALLALARDLYGHEPRGWIITVTGERFGHGESLSPRVHAAIEPAAILVESLISQAVNIPHSPR